MIALSVLPGVQEHSDNSDDDGHNKQKRNNLDHAVDGVRVGDDIVSGRGHKVCAYDGDSDSDNNDDADDWATIHICNCQSSLLRLHRRRTSGCQSSLPFLNLPFSLSFSGRREIPDDRNDESDYDHDNSNFEKCIPLIITAGQTCNLIHSDRDD